MRAKRKQKKTPTNNRLHSQTDQRLPFIEHLHELRRRLFYIVLSVVSVSLAAYSVQQHIVHILLAPSHGQHFIYTNPGGGLDFLFRVCIYTGIAVSIPLIIYQLLRYISPLFKNGSTTRFIAISSMISGLFAIIGVVFGYFVGLPAVLHFLFHQFTTQQIQPLITIQSYISFVTVYMLGSALLLQVPLIMIFINRIKPLRPSSLFHKERWVILGAFVTSAIMNPTPNIISQVTVAGPIIIMYQLGILVIWLSNQQSRRSPKVRALIQKDTETRTARLAMANSLKPLTVPQPLKIASPATTPVANLGVASLAPTNLTSASQPSRPLQSRNLYLDFRPNYNQLTQTQQ